MTNIIVYLSSANKVPLLNKKLCNTGVFLSELTEPLMALRTEGYNFTFATPDGKPPTIDKRSYRRVFWSFSNARRHRSLHFLNALYDLGLMSPVSISEIIRHETALHDYSGLLIPGGHAPMTDVVFKNWFESNEYNQDTGKLLLHFHKYEKPTALICHGVAALAAAPIVDGKWIYEGYSLTCVSMLTEWLARNVPYIKTIHGRMHDYPTPMLQRKAAFVKQRWWPMASQVIEDRELITGQDPYSALALGEIFKDKIKEYLDSH